MSDDLFARVLGCLVGSAIGDAYGAVVEFMPAEQARDMLGSDWIADYLPYTAQHVPSALGVWDTRPPRGAGTDDTRNNQIFVECVIRNGGLVNSQFLAIEYIERYRDRHRVHPEHAALAEQHLRWPYQRACAYLGMKELPSGRFGWVVSASGDGFPVLGGLISLAPAGLLHPAEPESAYMTALELAYMDVGYAKDATAMLAAMVSAAAGGAGSGREAVRLGLQANPVDYHGRIMADAVTRCCELADAASDERELVGALAREMAHRHVFDPADTLGVAAAAIHFTDGDPLRSIMIAANHRDLNDAGDLSRFRDVDCTGSVTGAIVGALRGVDAFPADWVADTIAANKRVYGIDLEANACRFLEAVSCPRRVERGDVYEW